MGRASRLILDVHEATGKSIAFWFWRRMYGSLPGPVLAPSETRYQRARSASLRLQIENGLYVSFNDGDRWEPLQLDLPPVPVSWMPTQRTFNDLVVSYGRGFFILDDMTPLQQLTPVIRNSASHLFALRQAYRFRLIDNVIREMSDDPSAGRNSLYGASINYWLGTVPPRTCLWWLRIL